MLWLLCRLSQSGSVSSAQTSSSQREITLAKTRTPFTTSKTLACKTVIFSTVPNTLSLFSVPLLDFWFQ